MPFHVNGRVLINGRGRAGMAVSNGETVVRTHGGGRYRLDVDPTRHRFVFVVLPDGAAPVGSFYRPVASLPGSGVGVDFELDRADQRKRRNFMFAQFTDIHAVVETGWASSTGILGKDVRKALSEWEPAFVVATGDLTKHGDLASLKAYRRLMRAAPCPVFNMFAAHDGQREERARKSIAEGCTRNYESILGPTYYSFDWGGRHFVVFANEEHMFAPPEAEAKAHWLWNDLKTHKGRPTVLLVHAPPSHNFLDTIVDTDVDSVFFGHWHSSKAYSYRGIQVFGTPPFAFGGIDKSPRSYRRIRIQQGRLTSELLPIRSRQSNPALPAPRHRFGAVKKTPLRLLWSRHLDTKLHRAAPVVCNEKILLALSDEDGKGRQGVLCLSLETGQQQWRRRTDTSVKNAVAISTSSQNLTENSGDLAVAVSVTGRLSAFDTRSGQTLWTTDLHGHPDRWIYTSPVVIDNVVYAGAKAGYGAYNLADGEPLWYYEPSSLRVLQKRVGLLDGKPRWYHEPTDTRSDYLPCYASPVVIQDTIVLFVQRTGMIGLERASGRELWRREMDFEYMYPQAVAFDGGVLSCGDRGELVKLDPKTGQILWRRQISEHKFSEHKYLCGYKPVSSEALAGLGANRNDVFVITPSGDCRAYSPTCSRLKWHFELGRELLDTTPYRRGFRSGTVGPVVLGKFIVIGAGDGHLYLVDRRTGMLKDRWWFGSPISAVPCVEGERLIVTSFDGLLACFDLVKG